ncbi:prepilin-type N-terminal cleavage/methylation domain-containing protein [Pseudidiomarina sp. 1APP75-32.1]|uniref:Prepilin-type N-terminal cleavage/methylation domain-containing protein n=1 Tax=Pseudidiomarina terrestris TaxID=2820060 RepID=A0AAW7R0H7_9GAMM|nr:MULTISPECIES: prepilin-type N-terminal cleavage/methylation domain-containing protein [unclassified Pseudidiomarina]MDN7124608.1 prepilin-type N-terminal cleavage/methylation domain-containing protein [Pseudidiomarina sp. 1APP75-32.1]MDN7129101.1 prepilin-type N-terminal cleavage/methylation domain-containing protein [Pseudidiomarina sp. 1APR75-15]MEA3587577.1 prepilin-type N-terminal cleavage/methylation domain-containing protein [Pseudidiomarina sp. 1APP75-27a]
MLKRQQKGLSIVELMITISLGLLLMAALTAVFANTLGVNARSLKLSQLQEEATAIMDLMVGDLRRTGYRGDAAALIYDPTNASVAFNDTIVIGNYAGEELNSCILFSYDADSDGVHDGASEAFGYRVVAGRIQRRQSSAGCTATGWQNLTTNEMIEVTDLDFTLTEQMFSLVNEQQVTVVLQVAMPEDNDINRVLATEVVIRNAF